MVICSEADGQLDMTYRVWFEPRTYDSEVVSDAVSERLKSLTGLPGMKHVQLRSAPETINRDGTLQVHCK